MAPPDDPHGHKPKRSYSLVHSKGEYEPLPGPLLTHGGIASRLEGANPPVDTFLNLFLYIRPCIRLGEVLLQDSSLDFPNTARRVL